MVRPAVPDEHVFARVGGVAVGPTLAAVQVASPRAGADLGVLRRAAALAAPDVLAATKTLPLSEALQPLVPGGALQRGTTVGVSGSGSTTLALALGVATSAAGSWLAVAGLPALGLAAADDVGICLQRLLVVADSPDGSWATMVAALLDAVDLVVAAPPARLGAGDARRLEARARERGAVLCTVGDAWPRSPDVRLTVTSTGWSGPTGTGSGRLEARRVEVLAGGRGAAARERCHHLWLPGPDGAVTAVTGPAAFGPAVTGPAVAGPARPDLAATG